MSIRRLPLRNRAGDVVAHAVVDAEDYDRVAAVGTWSMDLKGYVRAAMTRVNGRQRQVKLHRFILGLPARHPFVDHRDLNPLNNTRRNLRVCTDAQNRQNTRGRGGTSAYRGVSRYRDGKRWTAQGCVGGRKAHIGLFDTEEAANLAAKAWRAEHMPFSAEARGD